MPQCRAWQEIGLRQILERRVRGWPVTIRPTFPPNRFGVPAIDLDPDPIADESYDDRPRRAHWSIVLQDLAPVAGIHAVRSALKFGPEGVGELWLERSRRDRRLAELADIARAPASRCGSRTAPPWTRRRRAPITRGRLPGCAPRPPVRPRTWMVCWTRSSVRPCCCCSMQVQDPHNLGACLRTADAAGVHAVIAPKDNAVGLTPVVCKVASGAAETVPYIQVTNLARTMDQIKERGIRLIGTAGEAESDLYATDLMVQSGSVMGGEGSGLRRLTRERCRSAGPACRWPARWRVSISRWRPGSVSMRPCVSGVEPPRLDPTDLGIRASGI